MNALFFVLILAVCIISAGTGFIFGMELGFKTKKPDGVLTVKRLGDKPAICLEMKTAIGELMSNGFALLKVDISEGDVDDYESQ